MSEILSVNKLVNNEQYLNQRNIRRQNIATELLSYTEIFESFGVVFLGAFPKVQGLYIKFRVNTLYSGKVRQIHRQHLKLLVHRFLPHPIQFIQNSLFYSV